MTTINLLDLNHDILSLVLLLITPHDASQLALASRHAYAVAMPRVIAHVSLGGAFHKPASSPANLQLRRFCSWMLEDPKQRLLHLHSLDIRRDAVRVIADAVHLHAATIWGLSALVTAYPPIVRALASCKQLNRVTLGGDIPPLSTLAQAFPTVRFLHFVGGADVSGPGSFAKDNATPDHAWPRLDHVNSGHPILDFACSIRRVDLRSPLTPDVETLENALEYIRCTEPIVLSCVVDVSVADEEFVARIPEVACSVRYLDIALHGCESLASVTAWMMRVGPLLATLPLIGLSLSSSTPTSFPSPFSSPAASPPSSPRPVFAELPDVDSLTPVVVPIVARAEPPTTGKVATRVATSISSLAYVGINTSGPIDLAEGGSPTEWFVATSQGGRSHKLAVNECQRVERLLQGLNRYDR
ncbi:hypothetical protein IEO21_09812 [Rhodonia placenta]|uniref:F-box domain-containing protein n=1 Tax=Rhodonia placenta TaxID=104341 RepID=A0A8H7NTQ6_9APHY|nr:hypothetical protein IEO21_09812 [Postia placenta]